MWVKEILIKSSSLDKPAKINMTMLLEISSLFRIQRQFGLFSVFISHNVMKNYALFYGHNILLSAKIYLGLTQ